MSERCGGSRLITEWGPIKGEEHRSEPKDDRPCPGCPDCSPPAAPEREAERLRQRVEEAMNGRYPDQAARMAAIRAALSHTPEPEDTPAERGADRGLPSADDVRGILAEPEEPRAEGEVPRELPKMGDPEAAAKALSFLLPPGYLLMRREAVEELQNESEALRIERDAARESAEPRAEGER